MLADKMRHVLDTGAEVCTAGDSSCLMHIGGGLSRIRAATRTVHLAQILACDPGGADAADQPVGAPATAIRGLRRPSRDATDVQDRGVTTVHLGMPVLAPRGVGHLRGERVVPGRGPAGARRHPAAPQPRHTPPATIRAKRAAVVGELADWEELREAGRQLKVHTMAHLDSYLEQLEAAVTARGGVVHWARDAAEANQIVIDLVRATGADEVVKVKSMATQEIGLNEALEAAGIDAWETDLAELIVQLGHDKPVAHPGAGHPPQPGRDPGHLPAARWPMSTRI